MQQCLSLLHSGLHHFRIAINLSAEQFVDPELIPTLKLLLDNYELQGCYFELELTERTLVQSIETMLNIMSQIKAMGIHFAIDDFGIGFSSLSYLQQLPLDRIKVDRAFIRDIDQPAGEVIAETIINLGKRLNLATIAEGVEHLAQEQAIIAMGCDEVQGFMYAKPMPPSELLLFLQQQSQR